MQTLRIEIFGIACFADQRIDGQGQIIDPFQKRVLLPTDNLTFVDGEPPHIPYVEIAELDLVNQPGTIPGLSDRYVRDSVAYRRFELTEHRIVLEDVDPGQGWDVADAYNYRVVKMKEVLPTLDDHPNDKCFYASPPSNLIAGYFDISYGRLNIGDIDSADTAFTNSSWPKRRLAVSSLLEINVTGAYPAFRIHNVNQNPSVGTLVRLKTTNAGISIGNLPEDILLGGSRDHFTRDFKMFYALAKTPVGPNPPLPTRPAALQLACSNTNWP